MDGLVGPGDLLVPFQGNFFTHIGRLLGPLDREVLLLIYLDRAGAFLGDEMVAGGTERSNGLPYRQLFERTFKRGAAGLILIHNHPSGSPKPSGLDLVSTRGLQALAVPMDIQLVDHLIVGRGAVFSMRAAGLMGQ